MKSGPSKPKKIRVSIELDPELAEAFEDVARQLSKASGEPWCAAPVAQGLLSLGIARYRDDEGLGLALLQYRLSQFKTRKPNIKKVASQVVFGAAGTRKVP